MSWTLCALRRDTHRAKFDISYKPRKGTPGREAFLKDSSYRNFRLKYDSQWWEVGINSASCACRRPIRVAYISRGDSCA